MIIAIGSDHAGFEDPPPHYKPAIIAHLEAAGHTIIDCGPHGSGAVDYPDFARAVGEKIASGEAERGVLICGTGIGVSIAANRLPAVRAAVVCSDEMATLCRTHNAANVICLGRRTTTLEDALRFVDIFLETEPSTAERHRIRVEKMSQ